MRETPSLDLWLKQAKAEPDGERCGMYLFHNGVVRATAKDEVRQGKSCPPIHAMEFSHDPELVNTAVAAAKAMPGISCVRVWLNEGLLHVGDDIMLVLVGGDIRPHVVDALQALVGELKAHCVKEKEVFE